MSKPIEEKKQFMKPVEVTALYYRRVNGEFSSRIDLDIHIGIGVGARLSIESTEELIKVLQGAVTDAKALEDKYSTMIWFKHGYDAFEMTDVEDRYGVHSAADAFRGYNASSIDDQHEFVSGWDAARHAFETFR